MASQLTEVADNLSKEYGGLSIRPFELECGGCTLPSHGPRQFVPFGCCMVNRPDLFLSAFSAKRQESNATLKNSFNSLQQLNKIFFEQNRERIFYYHPYDAFAPVIEFYIKRRLTQMY